jgi:hypothetical protein
MRKRVLWSVLVAVLFGVRAAGAQDVLSADRIFLGTAGCILRSGSGTPEGVVTGSVCDTFVRSDTGDVYTKQSGTGNTGWTIVPRLAAANSWTATQAFTSLTASGSITATGNVQGNVVTGLRGIQGSFVYSAADPMTSFSAGFWFPRMSDLTGGYWLDYQDEFAYAYKWATTSVSAAVAPSGGIVDYLFKDTTETLTWNPSTSPFPIVIEVDATTSPIAAAGNGFYNLGITTRSTGAVAATNIKIEVWDGGAYVTKFNGPMTTSPIGGAWMSPRFTGDAGGGSFQVSKLKVTLSGTNPIAGTDTFRIQRLMLYHPTSTWDPWRLSRGGGTMYGDIAMSGANVGTSTYASQTTGWRIDSAGAADVRYLYTDELRAKLFTADVESVLAGSQRITKSFSTISQSFTCPTAGSTSTLWVNDSASFGDAAVFVSGDQVVIHSMSRTVFGPFTVTDCVGAVSAYADGTGANAGQQSWTFTRNAGADGGSMTASTVVATRNLVQDMGVSGNGYVESTAVDGPAGFNAPYIQTATWTGGPVFGNTIPRCRLGNLAGITGFSEYGLFCGNFSGNKYVRFSELNAEIRGIPLKLFDGSTETVRLDATVPSIALGNPLPSAYGTGTGVWMGKDSAVYKFRVGDPAVNHLAFDGTNLELVSGTLTVNANGTVISPATSFSTAFPQTRAYAFTPTSSKAMGTYGYEVSNVNYLKMFSQSGSSGGYVEASTKDVTTGSAVIAAFDGQIGAAFTGGPGARAEVIAAVPAAATGVNTEINITATPGTGGVGTINLTGKVPTITAGQGSTGTGYAFYGDTDTYFGSDVANRLSLVAGGVRIFWDGTQLFPETDGAANLGHSSFRWGTVYAVTGTINTSDARMKKNVRDTVYSSDFLLALRPVDFQWKNASFGTGMYQGFLAQDVAAIAPRFGGIHYGADGVADGLNYSAFIAPLVAAYQELESRVRALEGKR